VLAALEEAEHGLSVPELMAKVNATMGRIDKALLLMSLESPAAVQDILPILLREEPVIIQSGAVEISAGPVTEMVEERAAAPKLTPEAELWDAVRPILGRELAEERTEEEVATLLAIAKPQAKAWLARLLEETVIEKVKRSRPARFRTITKSDQLP